MADDANIDLTQEHDDDPELVRNLRHALKEANSRASAAEAEKASLHKQTTFRDLGIDIEKGPGRLLFEHYDGDISTEAIKAKAEEYGVVGQQQKEPVDFPLESPTPPKHDDSGDRKVIEDARKGSAGAGAGEGDEALSVYQQAREDGRTNEDAMAAFFSTRFDQAVKERRGGA